MTDTTTTSIWGQDEAAMLAVRDALFAARQAAEVPFRGYASHEDAIAAGMKATRGLDDALRKVRAASRCRDLSICEIADDACDHIRETRWLVEQAMQLRHHAIKVAARNSIQSDRIVEATT